MTAFEDDLPPGTRIAFFGYEIEMPLTGRTGTTLLYEPDPQGLMLESPTGDLVNVWGAHELRNNHWRRVTSFDALSEVLGDPA